jgi:hypothetical protein
LASLSLTFAALLTFHNSPTLAGRVFGKFEISLFISYIESIGGYHATSNLWNEVQCI